MGDYAQSLPLARSAAQDLDVYRQDEEDEESAEEPPMNNTERRRAARRAKNRESARRVRARRMQEVADLKNRVTDLQEENRSLHAQISSTQVHMQAMTSRVYDLTMRYDALVGENLALKTQLQAARLAAARPQSVHSNTSSQTGDQRQQAQQQQVSVACPSLGSQASASASAPGKTLAVGASARPATPQEGALHGAAAALNREEHQQPAGGAGARAEEPHAQQQAPALQGEFPLPRLDAQAPLASLLLPPTGLPRRSSDLQFMQQDHQQPPSAAGGGSGIIWPALPLQLPLPVPGAHGGAVSAPLPQLGAGTFDLGQLGSTHSRQHPHQQQHQQADLQQLLRRRPRASTGTMQPPASAAPAAHGVAGGSPQPMDEEMKYTALFTASAALGGGGGGLAFHSAPSHLVGSAGGWGGPGACDVDLLMGGCLMECAPGGSTAAAGAAAAAAAGGAGALVTILPVSSMDMDVHGLMEDDSHVKELEPSPGMRWGRRV